MAFDDGTPLDAAKLQALETELFNLRSSIPKIGTSVTGLNFTENATVTQKQILGGITDSVNLKPGQEVSVDIKYKTESKPTSIILTPVKFSGTLKGNLSYYVEGGTVGVDGARAKVYLDKSAQGFGIRFYFMVICS